MGDPGRQLRIMRIRLRNLAGDLPALRTQRRIAAILSAFDELIEINERRIELLEDLARSLYREWFVRFRFPGHTGCRVRGLRDFGPIPDGWTVRREYLMMWLKLQADGTYRLLRSTSSESSL